MCAFTCFSVSRVRGMRFFVFAFTYRPRGPNVGNIFFRKRSSSTANFPGPHFTPAKSQRPGRQLLALLYYYGVCTEILQCRPNLNGRHVVGFSPRWLTPACTLYDPKICRKETSMDYKLSVFLPGVCAQVELPSFDLV